MSRQLPFIASLLAAAALAAMAQPVLAAAHADPAARVERASPGRPLATLAQGTHRDAVAQRLRERGASQATADTLVEVARSRSPAGLTHLRFEQRLAGVAIVGSSVKAAFNDRGELVHLIDKLAAVPAATPRAAGIGERRALEVAFRRVHPGVALNLVEGAREGLTQRFGGGAFFHQDPAVTRVLVPMAGGTLEQGFLVQTWSQQANLLHHTLVDGRGSVLHVERRTSEDSYNVFTNSPTRSPQAVVQGPGAGNAQSPLGWLTGRLQSQNRIKGNNVSAYLDGDNNNRPDAAGTRVLNGNFLSSADFSQQPGAGANKAVAVQNLFYLNNVIHDVLYTHGFVEGQGNFQQDNFGLGGSGNDAVNAEAQDGGGINNANFATPPDGSKPRMQMYLWDGPGPTHELALDSGAIYGAKGAAFGPQLDLTGFSGTIVPGQDGILGSPGGTLTDGCEPLTNNVAGKIVLLDRGFCAFTQKAGNVNAAGGAGMIVANNVAGDPFSMGGTATVGFASIMVNQADGAALRAVLETTGTMRLKAEQPIRLDGAVDSDIVFHEYGHGLTWRMIGSMSGPLAGALGEGSSDTLAFMMNGDDAIAEYSTNRPGGLRRFVYSNYPLKYGDVVGASVHADGEIYAGAMWRLRESWIAAGRSTDTLFRHWVDGMSFTPAAPAYEHMRNGLLDSIALNGGNDAAACTLVWQAFAASGIGDGASGVVNGSTVTIVPSMVARSDCSY
jgi:extracellular elastinolytic metalloproteinase